MDHQSCCPNPLESLADSAVGSAHKVGADAHRLPRQVRPHRADPRQVPPRRDDPRVCASRAPTTAHRDDAASVARRLLLSRGIRPVVAPDVAARVRRGDRADADAGSKHHAVVNVDRVTKNLIAKRRGLRQGSRRWSTAGAMVVGVHRVVGDLILKIVECH